MEDTEPDHMKRPPQQNNAENECAISLVVVTNVGQESHSSKDSSAADSNKIIDTQMKRASPNVCPVDHIQIENDDECQISNTSPDDIFHINVSSGQLCQNPNTTSISMINTDVENEDQIDMEPQIGMVFESEDHAYKCYSKYAVLNGFSVRKDFVNKSRLDGAVMSRRYTCHRQGYRPNKNTTNLRRIQHETRTGCLAHMTIVRQPNGKFLVTHFEREHNHEFVSPSASHMLPSQRKLYFAQALETCLVESQLDGVPKLGMRFDAENHAYEFYNTYAGRVGFSVRKDYANRSKVDGAVASRRFTCFREGFRKKDKQDGNAKRPRKDTRIGCLAQLLISRQPDDRYHVTHFEEKHNHELVPPCRVQMLRSQKRSAATEVENNIVNGDGSNLLPNSTAEINCRTVEGFADQDYDPIGYEHKLPFKCTREIKEGEIEKIKDHFQRKQSKNPSSFYAFQLDAGDQLTNIFWADSKMIVDYSDFGDVVCFDRSYKFYKDCRPFAPFLGVNNHKQMIIFGAALLYDESVESLKWLFHVFIEAMSGRKPMTILTDQDATIAEAINSVLPQTNHRVCVWHIYQDAFKQLTRMSVESDSFVHDLSSCVFNHEEEEDFVNAWNALLGNYNLWDNEWLCEIYESRERWAIPYGRHVFHADIANLLRENLTGNLKKHLRNDSDVLSFLKHLGKMVTDWHYKELEANYDMSQRMPALMGDVVTLKHARDPYTPEIFELFQKEYEASLNLVVKHCTESGSLYIYKVSIYEQAREYTVTFDSFNEKISCSCMKFEYLGVLCCHALKVLDYRNIMIVPSQYILKRWTKDARI
ncbi:protein FAR1-RELATED SEQUENCE 5-like [Lotus japonicus]|uniref:protein FAR1-RELATED SEQUENCE 5-like n=1 Tax=Lotus japonicus TaxID=34305 RepID=UPI00258A9807|nr:protein FAR1-RELATED SEQUENCE 5-like [Lotus japonicus]